MYFSTLRVKVLITSIAVVSRIIGIWKKKKIEGEIGIEFARLMCGQIQMWVIFTHFCGSR